MKKFDLTGVGSPILDLLIKVDDSFLEKIHGDKGGMVLINDDEMNNILKLSTYEIISAPGGAAANTTFAAARLGLKTSFLGQLGFDDNAEFYKNTFTKIGGSSEKFRFTDKASTARCISLITPDAERTMRTNLGAALTLDPDGISANDFSDTRHVHIEGYLLFNEKLILKALESIKDAGCTVSIDMGSFEVVKASKHLLPTILENFVDIVFANEDESAAFCDSSDIETGLDCFSKYVATTIIKLGKNGSIIKDHKDIYRIDPVIVNTPVDTTAAGDFFAAGFLAGYLKNKPIAVCGKMGSLLGAECVRHFGTTLPENDWNDIKKQFDNF